MTATEERLTDALAAAAGAIDVSTLRPLVAPGPAPAPATAPVRRHWRHRLNWAAPLAAAASVLLVVGLAVAGQLAGTGRGTLPAAALPRYYVASAYPGAKSLLVRSVVTGSVTAVVPIPGRNVPSPIGGIPVVAAASNGTFFAAISRDQPAAEWIYQFRVTGNGKVSGFARVPGSALPSGAIIDAMAASPDGSQVAISVTRTRGNRADDQIIVIQTATGAKAVWRGAARHAGQFSVGSLSWTAGGRELAVLGQWCQPDAIDNENCNNINASAHRIAEVWALNPRSGGGQLSSGRLLLRQSARNPVIIQAVISPDGSFITAAVLTGRGVPRVTRSGVSVAMVPDKLSVRQISVATGQQLRVLFHRQLPQSESRTRQLNLVGLAPDQYGQHWMVWGVLNIANSPTRLVQFNGWIRDGSLVPLRLARGSVNSAAW